MGPAVVKLDPIDEVCSERGDGVGFSGDRPAAVVGEVSFMTKTGGVTVRRFGAGELVVSLELLSCSVESVLRWDMVLNIPAGGGRGDGTFAGEGAFDLTCSIEL